MTPHLRGNVRAYVDRALPPALLHIYDRHLVCCAMCRAAADQERRIVASLRSDTFVPGSLLTSLMTMASAPPPDTEQPAGPRIPLGPLAPMAVRASFQARGYADPHPGQREPLPTVPLSAPPMHRSPMRAAVVASVAAGASMAAAWGLAVSPLPGSPRTPSARVPAGVASTVPSFFAPASLPGSRADASQSPASQFWLVDSLSNRAMLAAQTVTHALRATPRVSLPTPPTPVRISFVLSAESNP